MTEPHEEESRFSSSDWSYVRRLLGYMMIHKRWFYLSLILYPLSALSIVIPPYLVQQILDVAIPTRDMDLFYILALVYLASVLGEYVTGFMSQLSMSILGQRSVLTLRTELYTHVQKMSASFYDRNPIGKTLTRLTNDTESLAEVFATGAVTILADVVILIGIVSAMLIMDVKLTLFAFITLPVLIALVVFMQRKARVAFRSVRGLLARINAFLAEHLAGMSVVQAFVQQDRTSDEFEELNRQYRDANRDAILVDSALFSIVEALGTFTVAILIWLGAVDLSTGVVGAGTLVAFIQYIRRFFVPIRDLSAKFTMLQQAFASCERIFSLLDEPIELAEKENARPLSEMKETIRLRDVSFYYKRDEHGEPDWVLKNVNLTFKRGEQVALVGPTGSGKTTILKLLNRLYDVQKGAIEIDGVDLKELQLAHVRKIYAVVLQDVFLFAGTIMENLSLGGLVSDDDVIKAARAVQADSFIMRLPDGYQTQVQELGSNFSAGERQLLAFARALALDPEVLVLDEATSNVDSATEERLQQALEMLLKDRTAICVAHRLSTIREVDRIIVLKHGEVQDEGTHEELMSRPGLYQKLAKLHFEAA